MLRILVKDDADQLEKALAVFKNAHRLGYKLHVLPIALLEVVWVLEKVYRLSRSRIREIVEGIIFTPRLKVEKAQVFLEALRDYEEKNIKFADALMAYWALSENLSGIVTFDRKHFQRIKKLEVVDPEIFSSNR
ncbi:type II toxin-antitoxin system VapC family toxin [Thermosulfuriphilus ammonigenes]|uniref:Type II toxin-antitoxin system VapC family toxin n=1 Tax=Thermosulfuriphilus ammonigenes TaxID=1936021 RepID=A0A6G7PY37_9BACT|nr:PIN domain-containing protein [Thermosulfuriphilus ammonigenes]MBA2849851.1 putative nucleic-acid-binding protein [Thermosulfuriphilus ammonigenes]QIJ72604.1 type II toxin-antitoxin system VapC family toxin [Thermosulfuriphilus ammonigenes]